jgi:hypothetical protein
MAGAGYKLFATGDVLTAAQVNTYLNEQTVMVFADSAARTSALSGVLAEGMVSYLQDTNAVEVYNGTAWVGVSGAGDVTEVQAGTGISVASGTGPIPVVTNTMATAIDAEGDLIIGDAADAFQRLAIGSNTHVLTVDTSVDGKIKWAAPAGGGKVLQVVQATTTTQATITATSLTDTNLSVSITPSSASSKVLILVSQAWRVNATVLGRTLALGALLRDSTNITINSTDNIAFGEVGVNTSSTFNSPDLNASGTWCLNYLDTPNTTSAITYKTQAYLNSSTTRSLFMQSGLSRSMIIALEIGA